MYIYFLFVFFPGHHAVHVEVDDTAVTGSPYTCNVYNVEKIKVTGLGTAKVSYSIAMK